MGRRMVSMMVDYWDGCGRGGGGGGCVSVLLRGVCEHTDGSEQELWEASIYTVGRAMHACTRC